MRAVAFQRLSFKKMNFPSDRNISIHRRELWVLSASSRAFSCFCIVVLCLVLGASPFRKCFQADQRRSSGKACLAVQFLSLAPSVWMTAFSWLRLLPCAFGTDAFCWHAAKNSGSFKDFMWRTDQAYEPQGRLQYWVLIWATDFC